MRVLVVERSKEARRQIVDALLTVESVAVQGAVADLQGAVDALTETSFDVVVTGVELGDASGLDLIHATHELAPASRIVVIGSAASREVWRQHLAAGADRFVEPDAELIELRDVIAGLVKPTATTAHAPELARKMTEGVMYELGDYLRATRTSVEKLERWPGDLAELARAKVYVEQAGRLAATLVATMRSGAQNDGELDLSTLVRRTLLALRPTFPPDVMMYMEIADGLESVRGIAVELEQIVQKLVLDAIHAMGDRGELLVRVTSVGGAVCFEVSDTAPRPVSKSAASGSGVVRRIVEQHGGAVAVAPRDDVPGTTTSIFLPVSRPLARAMP